MTGLFLNSQRLKHLVVAQSRFTMNRQKKQRAANIVLAIGALNGFVSTEAQTSTTVLRLNFSAILSAIANT